VKAGGCRLSGELEHDDREDEKKAHCKPGKREVSVGLYSIDVHSAAPMSMTMAHDNERSRSWFRRVAAQSASKPKKCCATS
jgi:hypothetical protein